GGRGRGGGGGAGGGPARGPGAGAGEPPAEAKERRADEEPRVDRARPRRKRPAEDRRGQAAAEPPRHGVDAEGAGHDEGERRIPCAGHIEKADDFRRVGHSGDGETHSEDEAARERDHQSHRTPPRRWFTPNAAAAPVSMNVAVAAIERGEPRPMPHTP